MDFGNSRKSSFNTPTTKSCHLICGLNVTQPFDGFLKSDVSSALTAFQTGTDLAAKAVMSDNRLILSQKVSTVYLCLGGRLQSALCADKRKLDLSLSHAVCDTH